MQHPSRAVRYRVFVLWSWAAVFIFGGGLVKRKRIKICIIAILTMLVIFGAVFFLVRPQRDPQLVGGWEQIDGLYTLWLYTDGSGSIEPDVPSIMWRTRGGQLMLTSMSVERYYEYSVSEDGVELILSTDRNGRNHSRMYVRVGE